MKLAQVRVRSASRGRFERGNEIIEFALFGAVLAPMMMWVFVAGMNLIRTNQCWEITRAVGKLYISGVDFSTYQAQQIAARLGSAYGLQIGSSFTGNNAANDLNGGNGYVVLSEIMFVGTASCASLAAGITCVNQNHYVFLQRVDFGNKNLQINGSTVQSAIGSPTGATLTAPGKVQNYLTDTHAAASNVGNYLTTQLADGQIAYVVEVWFSSPSLASFSATLGSGVHSLQFI